MLQVNYDQMTRTSDHFDTLIGYCEQLLREGKAFVDDTEAETMRKEREERIQSRNRNNCNFSTVILDLEISQPKLKSRSENAIF